MLRFQSLSDERITPSKASSNSIKFCNASLLVRELLFTSEWVDELWSKRYSNDLMGDVSVDNKTVTRGVWDDYDYLLCECDDCCISC
jgi:hypothetical protein